MRHVIRRGLAALLCALLATTVPAQTESEGQAAGSDTAAERIGNGQRFGAWTVTCEALAVNETVCVLTQRLMNREGNGFLAELLAFWDVERNAAYIAARVPTGVYLPSGFAMQRDGSEERTSFTWQTCSPRLCEALVRLSPEDVEAMSTEEPMLAGYRPGMGAEPLVFRLSLEGLDAGLEALK